MKLELLRKLIGTPIAYYDEATESYKAGVLAELSTDTGEGLVADDTWVPYSHIHEGTPEEISNQAQVEDDLEKMANELLKEEIELIDEAESLGISPADMESDD